MKEEGSREGRYCRLRRLEEIESQQAGINGRGGEGDSHGGDYHRLPTKTCAIALTDRWWDDLLVG